MFSIRDMEMLLWRLAVLGVERAHPRQGLDGDQTRCRPPCLVRYHAVMRHVEGRSAVIGEPFRGIPPCSWGSAGGWGADGSCQGGPLLLGIRFQLSGSKFTKPPVEQLGLVASEMENLGSMMKIEHPP